MKVKPLYTADLSDPYQNLTFIDWDMEFQGQRMGFKAPKEWSALAVEILWLKFARKKGVGKRGYEDDARMIFGRLAGAWRHWGERLGYFDDEVQAQNFENEILYMLAQQIAAPNSPQWFNTGLFEAYGIQGSRPEGHYAFDFDRGKVAPTTGAFVRPQAHACFIQAVSDELVSAGGLFDLLVREARLFKYGSGTGSNFSAIRASSEPLDSGGASSGLLSFLDLFDRSAGVIQSGGTTRRAAKMVCLDADHPDVMDFINYKKREEEKVGMLILGSSRQREIFRELKEASTKERALVAAKFRREGVPTSLLARFEEMIHQKIVPQFPLFTSDWEGAAYKSVSGQNANFSLRLGEDFFTARAHAKQWPLRARTSGALVKTLPARELWEAITVAAWSSADPGLQFHDTINDWNTCKSDGQIKASNPCSEYMFLDETACNLASLNLGKFLGREGFDFDAFTHACRLWTMVLDISVSMASYPSEQMAKNGMRYRTLGLGFANLGALLMRQGLAYDSEKGRALGAGISALMTGTAYLISAEMARSLGPYEAYEENRNSQLEVLDFHQAALTGEESVLKKLTRRPRPVARELMPEGLFDRALATWQEVRQLAAMNGVRNAQVSVVAPTGTIGLLMDCDTTGIEPEYSLVKYKKLSGGKTVKIVNQTTREALLKIGLAAEVVTELMEEILHERADLTQWLKSEEELRVFDCALPLPGKSARYISSEGHLLMMAAVQPFISGAISKTVNLPYETSPAEIGKVFERAHALMLKAIAIYRDGSKLGQPLSRTREVICAECGHSGLISSGSCFVCPFCGTSTGCS